MKRLLFSFFVIASFIFQSSTAKPVTSAFLKDPETLNAGIYLVIGVFEQETNAQRMTKSASQQGLPAFYKLHSKNKLYYVYTYRALSKSKLISAYYEIRSKTPFKDAWLLTVDDKLENTRLEALGEQQEEKHTIRPTAQKNPKEEAFSLASKSLVFAFENYDDVRQELIPAQLTITDKSSSKLISKLQSDEYLSLEGGQRTTDTLLITTRALGYQESSFLLDLQSDMSSMQSLIKEIRNDTVFVQFPLKQLEVGDFQTMYNTYFYANSTVMRLQSKHELDIVYNLLSRFPNMSIKVHGHTNGNSRGVAYLYNEEKRNYFDLIRTNEYKKRGFSSTKLSEYRAETIKSYLVHKGISEERIKTYGWGGKQMLFDEDSPMAKNNIRVEIEILNK
ncbi:OmpA family protein [Porifericola rhodea]|uniref:OmpA family protein n=1 Tax=Porifericola rhodea TaxID=930972 RepID=UPI00266615D2|nr:OmpA family protein [Porifericola rhodea]WKN30615.1 OmpA family protein [Porifericola rhodea]